MTRTKVTSKRIFYRYGAFYHSVSYTGFGQPTVTDSSQSDFGGVAQTMGGTVTYGDNYPDWKQRISRGDNATTSLSGDVKRVLSAKEGEIHEHWKMVPDNPLSAAYEIRTNDVYGYLGISNPMFSSGSEFSTISLTTASNRALARYNAKCAEVNRQFQGGVFFGEIAEALHGIRHPAEALFKGIEGYSIAATKLRRSFVKSKADFLSQSKRQRKKIARAFSEAASGLWLEKTFHWLPLMYDIQGAVSALTSTFDQVPHTFVKASATDKQSVTNQQSTYAGPSLYVGTKSTTTEVGASVKFYGVVRVRPRTPWVPDLAALGFDLRSFVPTLWELIPYSWAVDYFTNIGDIIYGASQGGCDVVWTAMGTRKYTKVTQRSGLNSKPPVPTFGWHFTELYGNVKESEVVAEHAQIARSTYTGSYIPTWEWSVPGMSLKWLNLGAVFLQRSAAFL